MPLRLTVNETTLSGQHYDDVIGVRHEFPPTYRKLVQPGERFVYYRGRRRRDGGAQPQVYLGVGIIGQVSKAIGDTDRLVCDIEDWQPFAHPLFFKDSSGRYYEPDGDQGGFYWQRGVRSLGDAVYERIVRDAVSMAEEPRVADAAPVLADPAGPTPYAATELAKAVDDYAMTTALRILTELWPDEVVARQPHNNPGFDVRVGSLSAVVRYVEVKGTTLSRPRFFLSEGERVFSIREAARYTLVVIYSINLVDRTSEIYRHDGVIDNQSFALTSRQWHCEARLSR